MGERSAESGSVLSMCLEGIESEPARLEETHLGRMAVTQTAPNTTPAGGISQQMSDLCPDITVRNTFLDFGDVVGTEGEGSVAGSSIAEERIANSLTLPVLPSFWPGNERSAGGSS